MGLFDKVKNLFTEEIEEPIVKKDESKKKEIKKEERRIEIAPARRENMSLLKEEIEQEVKVDEKPLPIYFSDEDFDDLEKPKEEKTFESRETYNKPLYQPRREEIKKEEKKLFTPSPIISPVYGILDKNYSSDDITTKDNSRNTNYNGKVTIDDVRNKAYGTLEDELESNLINDVLGHNKEIEETAINIFDELDIDKNNIVEEVNEVVVEDNNIDYETSYDTHSIEEEKDLTEELEKQKQKIEEINEIIKSNISPDKKKITSRKIDNILEELDEIQELIPEKITDNYNEENIVEENVNTNDELEESDLLNLIDSMYETRDDE